MIYVVRTAYPTEFFKSRVMQKSPISVTEDKPSDATVSGFDFFIVWLLMAFVLVCLPVFFLTEYSEPQRLLLLALIGYPIALLATLIPYLVSYVLFAVMVKNKSVLGAVMVTNSVLFIVFLGVVAAFVGMNQYPLSEIAWDKLIVAEGIYCLSVFILFTQSEC